MNTDSLHPDTLAFLAERSRNRQRANQTTRSDTAELVRTWFREGLALDADTPVSVSEVACADPSCPLREVVVVVMVMTAPPRQWTIGKPLTYIRRYDVQFALERKNGDGLTTRTRSHHG